MTLHPEIARLLTNEEVIEPETLRQLHPEISETEFNKIMATKVLIGTRGFFENMYQAEDMIQALNGRIPDPKQIQGCMPEEIWYAMEMAHSLFPDREFADEVIQYCVYFLNQGGVYIYPPFFPIPNPYYSKAVMLAESGPFPLGETTEEIQAAKYLLIQEYIKTR